MQLESKKELLKSSKRFIMTKKNLKPHETVYQEKYPSRVQKKTLMYLFEFCQNK